MDYLISPIRQELLARIKEGGSQWQNTLLVDFEEDEEFIKKLRSSQIQFVSLLQSNQRLGEFFPNLSIDDESLDCVIILLQMAWFDFRQVISQMFRVLKPHGKFYFVTLGPDTLIELTHLFSKVDDFPHSYTFVDMHHLGDRLLQTGFVKPILDVDRLNVLYPDISSLFFDLKAKKITNPHPHQRKTLTGKQRYLKLLEIAEQQGESKMTFEIIYGYAQKPDCGERKIKVKSPSLKW